MKPNPLKERSLLRRAVTSNLLLSALSGLLVSALYVGAEGAALDHQLRLRAATLTEFLSIQSQPGMLAENHTELTRIAANALSVEDVVFVELLDGYGRGVVRVSRPGIPAEWIPEARPLAGAVESVMALERHGRILDFRRPIRLPGTGGPADWGNPRGTSIGTVRIGFSMERQALLLKRTVRFGIGVVAICLLATLGVQYLQLRRLLQPLSGLIEFTRQVGRGELRHKAPVIRLDEIGRLSVAFNQMVEQLGSTTVSRNYFNNVLQSMAESVIVVDEGRRIRMVNRAAIALLGYSEEELVGWPASMIFAPGPAGGGPGASARGVERAWRTKEGREIPVLFSAAELPEEGDVRGQVWLAQDISGRKKAEENLRLAQRTAEQASRAKSEMLSRTSHELRTPLNSILGFAQLLEFSELGADDRENLAQILKAGRHLLRLINGVLDIAGVESGRLTVSVEPVAAAGVAAEAIEMVRPQACGRGIDISYTEAQFAGVQVLADRDRLQQALLNLLSNAVKYNRQDGAVVVDCEQRSGRMLRIRVHDTGAGIAPEAMVKLFTPFERLGAELQDIEGAGLGLSFARSLVEAMGGSVGVSSVVGEGSTFWIELRLTGLAPQAVEFGEEALPETPRTHAGSARRLLYIEDNCANLELVERVFRRRTKFQIIAASGGEEGVAAARQNLPDLILLDVHLPDIPGDEVLRRLRSDPATAQIPIVMLSAGATPKQIERLLAGGAQDYLPKPIDVHDLLRVVDERLKERTYALPLISN